MRHHINFVANVVLMTGIYLVITGGDAEPASMASAFAFFLVYSAVILVAELKGWMEPRRRSLVYRCPGCGGHNVDATKWAGECVDCGLIWEGIYCVEEQPAYPQTP